MSKGYLLALNFGFTGREGGTPLTGVWTVGEVAPAAATLAIGTIGTGTGAEEVEAATMGADRVGTGGFETKTAGPLPGRFEGMGFPEVLDTEDVNSAWEEEGDRKSVIGSGDPEEGRRNALPSPEYASVSSPIRAKKLPRVSSGCAV
jgi:hypothetical protein